VLAGTWAGVLKSSQTITSFERLENILPTGICLQQNYPNPFNPTTKIKYSIPILGSRPTSSPLSNHVSTVQLKVYDILGNEIATLVNEEKAPGAYEVEFSAKTLASGIYFYKLSVGPNNIFKKMIVIK